MAQLADTIENFPGGYDTVLGERGINLSGGQKQRAALARALARKPAIVLLDDALSAVDTHTEAEILRSLREALAGRTALIASHRVSAIRDATWIIVLDEGRVVEQGQARRPARGRRALLVAFQPPAARGVDRGGSGGEWWGRCGGDGGGGGPDDGGRVTSWQPRFREVQSTHEPG